MTEAELQAAIIEAARWTRWLVYHTHDSRRSQAGFPDLILLHPRSSTLVVAELKSTKGRITPEQRAWLDAFAAIPCCRVRVYRPCDLDVAITELAEPDKEVTTCAWSISSTRASAV